MLTRTEATWGWFRDPYEQHEDRYFSQGMPTKLVRDSGLESFDPPPDLPLPHAPVAAASDAHGVTDGADLRRADDAQRVGPYARGAALDRVAAAISRYGSAR